MIQNLSTRVLRKVQAKVLKKLKLSIFLRILKFFLKIFERQNPGR